ncbi:hypothetical protein [Sphingobacterium sp.]|uniref:hypothetical protein n=1 Tax=Sphingobacterium sp. TaxID=341027 RepID=UPI00289E8895|nr:hypothetical protein [Sphingobacterium sp.]
MMNNSIKINFSIILLCFSFLACKTEYTALPFNHIESFKITDAEGKLVSASIVGDRIVLYWSPYQEIPASINPQIQLAENATVRPASGEKIDLSENQPVKYTVTAQDGKTKIYNLEFFFNQPYIRLSKREVPMTLLPSSVEIGVAGEHFLPEIEKTKAFLIDATKKEVPLKIKKIKAPTYIDMELPENFEVGFYQIRIISGIRSAITEPFEVKAPGVGSLFSLDLFRDRTKRDVRIGDKLRGTYHPDWLEKYHYKEELKSAKFQIYDRELGKSISYPAEVVVYKDKKEYEITIPKELPKGQLENVQIFDQTDKFITNFAIYHLTLVE